MRTLFLRANSRRVFLKKDEGEEFEERYLTKDLKLEDLSLEQMDELWEEAKILQE